MVCVARLVDAKGDLMVLDNMGICLQVNTCLCGRCEVTFIWWRVGSGGGGRGEG